jgi:hypothetical protein
MWMGASESEHSSPNISGSHNTAAGSHHRLVAQRSCSFPLNERDSIRIHMVCYAMLMLIKVYAGAWALVAKHASTRVQPEIHMLVCPLYFERECDPRARVSFCARECVRACVCITEFFLFFCFPPVVTQKNSSFLIFSKITIGGACFYRAHAHFSRSKFFMRWA